MIFSGQTAPMLSDYRSKFKISLRRARNLWKHRWANWGPRPVNGGRQFVPPGHFYSPIPALDYIRANERSIFDNVSQHIRGIDLHEAEQLELLDSFKKYYDELPFPAQKIPDLRYFFEAPNYSYSDAIFLYCMMRHAMPRRIIEVGSGYSSCLMLDTNDLYFNGSIATTFIDPHPELLLSQIKENDRDRMRIIGSGVQDVDFKEFEALQANDILSLIRPMSARCIAT